MAVELNKNNTLYGLHIEGNKNFIVDPRGYMTISGNRDSIYISLIRQTVKGVKKIQNIN